MKLKNIKWSTIKLMFVSHVFGKTAAAIYKSYVYNCNTKNFLKAGEHITLVKPLYLIPYVYNCNTKNFLKAGEHITLVKPLYLIPQRIELGSYTRIQPNVKIIASKNQKVIIKKFSAIGAGSTIIPGNHTPTVSIPQFLSYLYINDVNHTLIVGEDVWVGANSTLLSKGSIGRGAVVAANAVVSKEIPPYAVVGGIPAKIIAVRFSIDQILEHEASLYPPEERFDRDYLEKLFKEKYSELKTLGTSIITPKEIQQLTLEKSKYRIEDYSNL